MMRLGRPRRMPHAGRAAAALLVAIGALAPAPSFGAGAGLQALDGRVAERVKAITRKTEWRLVASIPLRFETFHPQGMLKIGADFYLSSVEVLVSPKPMGNGSTYDAGVGVGHLFKFSAAGVLLADRRIGEGSAYHPGGIDFDGRFIWAPVSEYRPNSRAIVYRVDPATLTASEAFRFHDHIGAVAFDRSRGELRGLSWGSRRFYRWRIDGRGGRGADARFAAPATPNRFHYIDFQDCHYVGRGRMLCGGLADYPTGVGDQRVQLGGLDLVDLGDDRPVWQAPVSMRSAAGRPMTQNPFFIEATDTGLRAYFVPDDDQSTLYVYEVATGGT